MKRISHNLIFVLLSAMLLNSVAFGQTRKHAFSLLDEGKIHEAQSEYYELMKLHGDDPLICFEMGIALYLGNTDDKVESARYFELAKQNSIPGDTIPELFYYLGRAYQASNDFKKAKKSYDSFESNLKVQSEKRSKQPKGMAELQTEVEEYIEKCMEGLRQIRMTKKNPLTNFMITGNESKRYYIAQNEYYTVENLGPQVNSIYDDYAPVFANNEQTIMFTSRRNSMINKKYPDGLFYEDIFTSSRGEDEWGAAQNIDSSELFQKDSRKSDFHHNASVSINSDETELYTYAFNNIYVSIKEGDKWSKPKKMSSKINIKKARQSSAVISPDGKLLLIVSDKEGGYGGSDIYYSEQKKDGVWSDLINIGETINTDKDEETPWMNPSMDTLFFSSKGHRNIGGFDVFFSSKGSDGKWSTPKNMGIPVNTALDELSYMESRVNSRFAYYASNRTGGHGYFDIYHISRKFEEGDDMITAKTTLAKRDSILEEIGSKYDEVYVKKIAKSLADGKITKEEVQKIEQEIAQYTPPAKAEENTSEAKPTPSSSEPQKVAAAPQEKARTTKETLAKEEVVKTVVPEEKIGEAEVAPTLAQESSKETTPAKTPPTSSKIANENLNCKELMSDKSLEADVHFAFNDVQLGEGEKSRLSAVAKNMKLNANSILSLTGHTDDIGSEEVNKLFAANRVQSVFNYIVSQGIDANRFVLKEYGESQPKVSNSSSTCRAANSRVEVSLGSLSYYGNVYFKLNSSAINPTDQEELNRLLTFLKSNPSVKIELSGYTDSSGSAEYNRILAGKRIQTVVDFLISKGISDSKMIRKTLGEDVDLIPNYVSGAAKLNRRVQLKVQ